MLDKLAKTDLGGAEIMSTLYAVWNNRLIQQEPVTDDLLVTDFYAWSDHKSDFPESRVRNCLDYMRTQISYLLVGGDILSKERQLNCLT